MSFSPDFFASVISHQLPEPHASLLNGILFGIDLRTSKTFSDELNAVGLLHLVVLSGTNITLLASLTGQFTRFFSKRVSILITVLTIFLFIIFVRPKAPIVRAGIMGMLTYVAILTGRKNVSIYSLLLSLIFIAIFFPRWITSISLLLSYGATVGMIIFSKNTSKNPVIAEFKTSLAAQVFTAPIIFVYFKQISLISPVANILVAPLILPLMVFGFLLAILGSVNHLLGILPAVICYGILSYVVFVIKILAGLPFAYYQFQ